MMRIDIRSMNQPLTQQAMDHIVEELAALRVAFEAMQQAALVIDAHDQQIVDANPAACQTLGLDRGELIGRPWTGTDQRLPSAALRRIEVDGRRVIVLAHEPIAEQTERSDRPRDVLTGLPGREALLERTSLDSQGAGSPRTALLFIDLDNFKQVNDTWGHVAGDRVLRVVAERLSECIRPSDLLIRYGGDEFVVVVDNVRRRRDLERLARRIVRGVERPVLVAGHECTISASVGIAQRNDRLTTIDALIVQADRDMYRAKSRRRESYVSQLPGDPPIQRQSTAGVGTASS
jgi:diguanylate cyclase (GGDEF)-like protein